MIGIVLAAGGGTRLLPLTDQLPKTMLAVHGQRSIFELAVANLSGCGVDQVVVVTGHRAGVIEQARDRLEATYGVTVELRHNPRHAELNNAYSLWTVRDVFDTGAVLVNGDTVHPASVERTLIDVGEATADLSLTIDDTKRLGQEEMKVVLSGDGRVEKISKSLDPGRAHGEYIGVARIHPGVGQQLADALQATFERDGTLYYEDGFQELVDRGGRVGTRSIGNVPWVEVDDHRDLATARDLPHPL